jgi:uncharacterized protein YneF (UPF0154 family)
MSTIEESPLLQAVASQALVDTGLTESQVEWIVGGTIVRRLMDIFPEIPPPLTNRLEQVVHNMMVNPKFAQLEDKPSFYQLKELMLRQLDSEPCLNEQLMMVAAEELGFKPSEKYPEYGAVYGLFKATAEIFYPPKTLAEVGRDLERRAAQIRRERRAKFWRRALGLKINAHQH